MSIPNRTPRKRLDRGSDERLYYPSNVSWRCLCCAECCGDVPGHDRSVFILASEAGLISKEMKLKVKDFAVPAKGSGQYTFMLRKHEGRCVFLEKNNCRIYEIRPLVCQFYPIWLRHEASGYHFGISDSCPGLGEGECLQRNRYITLLRLAQAKLRDPH